MWTTTGDYRAEVKRRIWAKRAKKERLREERRRKLKAMYRQDEYNYSRPVRALRGVFISKAFVYSLISLPVIALAYIIYVNVAPYI